MTFTSTPTPPSVPEKPPRPRQKHRAPGVGVLPPWLTWPKLKRGRSHHPLSPPTLPPPHTASARPSSSQAGHTRRPQQAGLRALHFFSWLARGKRDGAVPGAPKGGSDGTGVGSHSAPADLQAEERLFNDTALLPIDLITPDAIQETPTFLQFDGTYARTLAVVGYPPLAYDNWLGQLYGFPYPLEICQHIRPLDTATMIKVLTRKQATMETTFLQDAKTGRVEDVQQNAMLEEVRDARDALARNLQRMFSFALSLTVRASTLDELDRLTRQIEVLLGSVSARSQRLTLQHDLGMRSGLPAGRDLLPEGLYRRTFTTTALCTVFPLISPKLSERRGILYGLSAEDNGLVVFHPFSKGLANYNLVIFAVSGAGKSFFAKVEAIQALLLGIEAILIDPEMEYRTLCDAVGGQYIPLSTSSPYCLNPFDLPVADEGEAGETVLRKKVQLLLALLALMAGDGSLQVEERALLDKAILETYARAGITADARTHGMRPPLLEDLHALLLEWANTGTSLAASLSIRLERFVSGSLCGLFAGQTNVNLRQRLIVFNVRDLEKELRPIGLLLVTDFIWTRIRASRKARLLYVDEAWLVKKYAADFLEEMVRRARKYYLGLRLITQSVMDFWDGSDCGRALMENSALKLLMLQSTTHVDAAVAAFGLTPEERNRLLNFVPGQALFFALGGRVEIRVEVSEKFYHLANTNALELEEQARRKEQAGPDQSKPIRVGRLPRNVW